MDSNVPSSAQSQLWPTEREIGRERERGGDREEDVEGGRERQMERERGG